MRRIAVLLIWMLGVGMGSTSAWADGMDCLSRAAEPIAHREYPIQFNSADLVLRGRLFVPDGKGPYPAVVLLHGGGRERLNEAPLFFAPLLARCGIAALVYDKRGTGASEGTWETAHFDDFVADAAAAVAMLGHRTDIQSDQIGLIGFSQGGRLAPVVAVQRPEVAFIVSISGPFVSLFDTRMYALRRSLRQRGLQGDALDATLAAWASHFKAVAAGEGQSAVLQHEPENAPAAKPSVYVEPPSSPVGPFYNSLYHDYTVSLKQVQAPMLAIYGARDAVVPVEESIAVLQQALRAGGREPEVIVFPYADHSLIDRTFRERIKVEEVVLGWIQQQLAPSRPASYGGVTAQ